MVSRVRHGGRNSIKSLSWHLAQCSCARDDRLPIIENLHPVVPEHLRNCGQQTMYNVLVCYYVRAEISQDGAGFNRVTSILDSSTRDMHGPLAAGIWTRTGPKKRRVRLGELASSLRGPLLPWEVRANDHIPAYRPIHELSETLKSLF